MAVVYELIKREDGSTAGIGNSYECSDDEAKTLIKAGTHIDIVFRSGAEQPAPAVEAPVRKSRKSVVEEVAGEEDGNNRVT